MNNPNQKTTLKRIVLSAARPYKKRSNSTENKIDEFNNTQTPKFFKQSKLSILDHSGNETDETGDVEEKIQRLKSKYSGQIDTIKELPLESSLNLRDVIKYIQIDEDRDNDSPNFSKNDKKLVPVSVFENNENKDTYNNGEKEDCDRSKHKTKKRENKKILQEITEKDSEADKSSNKIFETTKFRRKTHFNSLISTKNQVSRLTSYRSSYSSLYKAKGSSQSSFISPSSLLKKKPKHRKKKKIMKKVEVLKVDDSIAILSNALPARDLSPEQMQNQLESEAESTSYTRITSAVMPEELSRISELHSAQIEKLKKAHSIQVSHLNSQIFGYSEALKVLTKGVKQRSRLQCLLDELIRARAELREIKLKFNIEDSQ